MLRPEQADFKLGCGVASTIKFLLFLGCGGSV